MSEQRKRLFSTIGRSLGVDLLSYDFVHDPSYLSDRCGRVLGGEPQGRSLLRCLLHSGLSENDRARIFPGKFDLGNARLIPAEACTYEALRKELEPQRTADETRNNPLDKTTVKRLLKDVAALLGHAPPQEAEADVGQIFKVAKLLHGFKQREGLSQLLSILRPPSEAKASLELTNPYPIGADSDLRWQLVDLHGYVSAEISSERLAEIDSTFGQIRSVLDQTTGDIEFAVKTSGRPAPDEIVQRYALVLEQWTSHRRPPARQVLRADEQLYIAMHVLDFLHFAAVERKLRHEKLLQRSVVPVSPGSMQFRIRLCDLRVRPVPTEVRRLHPLLSEAVGEEITSRQFRGYIDRARTLLKRWLQLLQTPAPEDVDAVTALAAIIVARDLQEHSPTYKPGLHGAARGQSQSLKAAMKVGRLISSPYEEFERIVTYAIDWTRYALSAQTAILEAQLTFRMHLLEAAVTVLNTHDTGVVATFISNLEGYSAYGVRAVPRLVALKTSAPDK